MTTDNNLSKLNNLLSLLRRKEAWQEVDGYHVGNIHSPETAVSIPEGSTVVGNVFAPKVSIGGLLCGSLVATEAEIGKGGQVWGDIFAVSVAVKPGSQIMGWLKTIDEETAVYSQQEASLPLTENILEPNSTLLDQIDSDHLQETNPQAHPIFHQLLAEVTLARAARAEIEEAFDERISEVAGSSSEKIHALSDQLDQYQAENITLSNELKETQESLAQKEEQLNRHQTELELTRNQINVQQQSEAELTKEVSQLRKNRDDLERDNKHLNEELTAALINIDNLTNRVQSVEEAMKDSLQHSSELQDSLERWQELAEVTEAKAKRLEKEIATLTFEQEGSDNQLELLKEQKKQVENEWQQARTELEAFRTDDGNLANEAATELFIDEASQRMARLENSLLDMAQNRAEQQAWYQLNLENRSQKITELSDELSHLTKELAEVKQQLGETKMKLGASEADLNYHLEEIQKQGNHLAEIQLRLSEREAQLKQARTILKKQQATFEAFKKKAAVHIKKLQAQLDKQKTA